MADEVPPPAYEDVMGCAPHPPRYISSSRQDPDPAKRRLVQSVDGLKTQALNYMPHIRKMTTDIDTSYMRLKSQRARLDQELTDWKTKLISHITAVFDETIDNVRIQHDTAEHKLILNREKILETFESTRQLCWQSNDLTSSRNQHALVLLKRKFEDKLQEIDSLITNVSPQAAIPKLQFVKAEITPESVQGLVGKIETVRSDLGPLTPVTELPRALRSHRRNEHELRPNPTQTNTENRTQTTTDSSTNEGSEREPAQTEHPEATTRGEEDQVILPETHGASSAAPVASEIPEESPPTYRLIHTIQTKTFKDKARCHPLSFAVDFDGNIIVADKFNKNLKIFTQTGQLIKEITHPALLAPTHTTLTLAGDIAVSDSEAADVKFFSTQGTLIGSVPRLTNAGGIVFNLMGDLLVTDTSQKAVHVVDAQVGKIKSTVQYYTAEVDVPVYTSSGAPRTRREEQRFRYFEWPHYITTGPNDEIMVTDRVSCDYKVFGSSGHYWHTVGSSGKNSTQFSDPYGICTYMGQNILVADYGNHRIQNIDLDGNFKEPLLNVEHGLHFPTYVTYTTDEKVMVSEYLSGKVKIFTAKSEGQEDNEPLPPAYTDVVGLAAAAQPVESPGAAGDRYSAMNEPYYYDGMATAPNLVVDPYFYDDIQSTRPILQSQPSWETSI